VEFGSIPTDSGVLAAYSQQIDTSDDPDKLRQELEEQFRAYGGPYPAAGSFNVDDVIDPRETRPRIIQALKLALNRRSASPHPVMRHGVMP